MTRIRSVRLLAILFHLSLFTFHSSLLFAQGPQEIAVLVNVDSEDSKTVAKEYVKLRNIPFSNLIPLRLPERKDVNNLTPDQFTDWVWNPVNTTLKKRGIDGHILAWVYSVDMPIRVTTDIPVSIHGATFYRNDFSFLSQVTNGQYLSPMFAGPSAPGGRRFGSQALGVLRDTLGTDMPLPAMSLGYTGKRGCSVDEVLTMLRRGRYSDATQPGGTVYFVTRSDVRSTCRAWQFPETVKELRALGVPAIVTDQLPTGQDVAGLMLGAAEVDTDQIGGFVPGAMAEHLTSSAAVFESSDQTKLTAWLKAGAVASAGTVTEPLAMWMKFPHSRFFVHYAAGCTVLESFYQSVRSPAQLLMVGDPLAQPWKPAAELRVSGKKKQLRGTVEWTASVKGSGLYRRIAFFLDGRPIGQGTPFMFDTTQHSNGLHRIHAVAYQTGPLRNQAMATFNIEIQNP